MHGDLISTISGEWKAWKKAFNELPDNPLAQYFALMRKRRLAKLPWYRRYAIMIWGGVASAIYLLYVSLAWGSYLVSQGTLTPQQETTYLSLQVAGGIISMVAMLMFFWLLQQLFSSLYFALGFLGLPGTKDSSERIDDLVGVSNVTNHELGAVVVSHNFGVLFRPIVFLTLFSQMSGIIQAATTEFAYMGASFGLGSEFTEYSNWGLREDLLQIFLELPIWKQLLVTLPFDIAYSLVTSLLGVLIITGLFVVLGRNLRHSAALASSVVFFILWLVVFSYVITYSLTLFTSGEPYSFWSSLRIMATGTLIIPGLSILLMRASLKTHSLGLGLLLFMLLVFLPLVLMLVSVYFGFMWSSFSYIGNTPGLDVFSLYLREISWGGSAFSPISVASVFPIQSWQWMSPSVAEFPWHELSRAPILIMVQLLTLEGLSIILLKAISLRRQGQG